MRAQYIARLVAIGSLVILIVMNGFPLMTEASTNSISDRFGTATPDKTQIAPERANGTVITAYGGGNGHLIALNPNGTLRSYIDYHDEYYDVDPINQTHVVVAAMDELTAAECPASHPCTLEIILVVNLDTKYTKSVYERYRKGTSENEWHDVDRIGESRYLVAEMERESVFIVNTSTEMVTWRWDSQSHYNISTGGSQAFTTPGWPEDWTHLNDVEQLPDGRIMVSMRNHDEILFINKTTGVNNSWTIGENDDTSILFEQHNPDYIPETRGGPAVIVADSQNNRIIEYQRENGEWNATYEWSDADMQWPRDADRLPNGHTLIADSNSGRIIEVDETGTVVWSVNRIGGNYDVERIGTGDESTGGESALELGLVGTESSTRSIDQLRGTGDRLTLRVKSLVPPILLNSLIYVTPTWWNWIGLDGALFTALTMCVGYLLLVRLRNLQFRSPVVFNE
jgi:hypothetical protein